MVQKIVEEVANDADKVVDLLLGVQLKLSREFVGSRNESV